MGDVHLYYAMECPSSRAVLMAIHAFAIQERVKMTRYNLKTKEHLNEEYKKINPRQKVPTLTVDGAVITESRSIITYLADKYLPQDNKMYPHDLMERAQINAALYFDIGVVYSPVHDFVLPQCIPDLPMVDMKNSENKAVEALNQMELLISDKGPYIRGENFTIADISSLGTAIMLLGIGYPLTRWPKIEKWIQFCQHELPWFEVCNRFGIDNLNRMYAAKKSA